MDYRETFQDRTNFDTKKVSSKKSIFEIQGRILDSLIQEEVEEYQICRVPDHKVKERETLTEEHGEDRRAKRIT